jgi:hypothetical protein
MGSEPISRFYIKVQVHFGNELEDSGILRGNIRFLNGPLKGFWNLALGSAAQKEVSENSNILFCLCFQIVLICWYQKWILKNNKKTLF